MLLNSWQRESSLVFELPDGEQWRITVGTASHYDAIRYRAMLQKVFAYFPAEYGVDLRPLLKAQFTDANATDEQKETLNLYWEEYSDMCAWASALAALRRVETRPNADAEWQQVEVPKEWQSPTTALRHLPPDMIDIVGAEVYNLNPDELGFADASKKTFKLIESPSMNGSEPSSTPKTKRPRKSKVDQSSETISPA